MACRYTKSYLSLLRAACTLVGTTCHWNTSMYLGGQVALYLSGNSMFSGLDELASACLLCSFGVCDVLAFKVTCITHGCAKLALYPQALYWFMPLPVQHRPTDDQVTGLLMTVTGLMACLCWHAIVSCASALFSFLQLHFHHHLTLLPLASPLQHEQTPVQPCIRFSMSSRSMPLYLHQWPNCWRHAGSGTQQLAS